MSLPNTKKSAHTLIAIFIALTLLLCVGGHLLYQYQKKNITIDKYDELAAINKMKIGQIVNWRKERIEDGQSIYFNEAIINHIHEYIQGKNHFANYLTINNWINTLLGESDYSSIFLISPSKKIVLESTPGQNISWHSKTIINQAVEHKKVEFSDLNRNQNNQIYIDLAVPLFTNVETHQGFSGVILLQINPNKFLYPFILNWPTPSKSSECILFCKEKDSILFLSELEHKKSSALQLKSSLNGPGLLSDGAFSGATQQLQGIDYRGVKTLGIVQQVPGSTWFVLTKVDAAEIYHPVITFAIWTVIIIFLLILVAALIIFIVWNRQTNKSEREHLALRQHFDYVLKYANDIIILADFKNEIYEVNEKCLNTYGYTYLEMLGMNLSRLRAPDSRDTLEQQLNLLQEANGYLYETIHISKNGIKFPVEVSGRIMFIQGKKYIQLIIRDITYRKQSEERLQVYQQHLESLVEERTTDLLVLNHKLEQDIAERKLIEDKLRQSEQRLRLHFKNSPLAIVEWDADFIVNQWSKEAENIFGWKAVETIGKHIGSLNMIYEEDLGIVDRTMERLMAGVEKVVISDNRNYTKSGKIVECVWHNSILLDEEGKMASVMSLVEDVTERKKIENELRKLSRAVEQSPVSIIITDLDGTIEYCNSKTTEITGYSFDEVIGRKPGIFKSGMTPRDTYKQLWNDITTKKEWQGEFLNKKKNGELFWEAASISAFMDAKGNITNFLAIKEDITDRKIAEEELKKAKNNLEIRVQERTLELAKSEERFRSTLDNLKEGCMFLSFNWEYLYVNDSIAKQMRSTSENLIGRKLTELHSVIVDQEIFRTFNQVMMSRKPCYFKSQYQFTDGVKSWFDLHVEPVNEGIFVISSDITERVEAEEKLQASEAGFRTLSESIPQLVWIAQTDGMLIYFNQRWFDYTGLTLEESCNTGWTIPYHPDDRKLAWNAWKHATQTGEKYDLECRLRQYDETYHWFVIRGVPLRDSTGNIINWYGTCTEIDSQKIAESEVKKLNEQLEQRVYERTFQLQSANKELEAFSYSVSHDLRAPLRSIDGWSMALLEDYYDQIDDQGKQYIERVRTETQRMGHLIDDLLKLSRVSRTDLNKEWVDMTALAQEIGKHLLSDSKMRDIELKIQPNMIATGDPSMIRIAILNLLGNAFKFTSKQPRAIIEFGHSQINNKPTFWIRDNGVGFDMTYSKNLFGAFQRLHKQSDFPGTGVGLATVQRIIHRHDGLIWAESAVNIGTTFFFTLSVDIPK